VAVGEPSDPRVSGRCMQLGQRRRLGELPGKRVLTATGADEENTHCASLSASDGDAVDREFPELYLERKGP